MDHHLPAPITAGLRVRGIDVPTAAEGLDADLLTEAALRQRRAIHFAGLIYAHQLHIRIGQAMADLALVCEVYEPDEFQERVDYIPLK